MLNKYSVSYIKYYITSVFFPKLRSKKEQKMNITETSHCEKAKHTTAGQSYFCIQLYIAFHQ